jgi:FixJ family two-component response regulator
MLPPHMSSAEIIYVAIVDDDESICRSLSRLLQTVGFRPVCYPSAQAFLDDWKHPRFDCMLLDIQMPGMTGIELKEHLNRAGSVLPVIYVTAHEDAEAREEALASGCEGYFRKTAAGNEILDAIRRAIARSKAASASTNPPTQTGGTQP